MSLSPHSVLTRSSSWYCPNGSVPYLPHPVSGRPVDGLPLFICPLFVSRTRRLPEAGNDRRSEPFPENFKSVTLSLHYRPSPFMLIMQIGRLTSLGYEKIILLYNGSTYETADVISTYVYRRGILSADF